MTTKWTGTWARHPVQAAEPQRRMSRPWRQGAGYQKLSPPSPGDPEQGTICVCPLICRGGIKWADTSER